MKRNYKKYLPTTLGLIFIICVSLGLLLGFICSWYINGKEFAIQVAVTEIEYLGIITIFGWVALWLLKKSSALLDKYEKWRNAE